MAYARSLASLRESVLVHGQYENSADITPAVANEYINDALVESYDRIVERGDDYYTVLGDAFTTTSGTNTYSLPSDFYKLRKVEILISGSADDPQARWQRLFPISVDDTHRRVVVGSKRYKYRVARASLILYPTPSTVIETLRVYYITQAPQLIVDTDTVQFDTPVEEHLVIHMALREIYQRQDLSTAQIDARIERLTAQLRSASDHDASEPFYLGRRTGDEHDGDWEY